MLSKHDNSAERTERKEKKGEEGVRSWNKSLFQKGEIFPNVKTTF